MAPNENNIQLAILAFQRRQFRSIPAAARAFGVCSKTVRRRVDGIASRRDRAVEERVLTQLEERAIIEHALDVDARGFQLNYALLREIANKLLADRGADPVGINWPTRFITRVPELKVRYNRKYDYQRALNESPQLIEDWFRLVRNTINKYGIQSEDIYNFDEAGFQTGQIKPRLVITGLERRQTPKTLQLGQSDWVTTIICINAEGYVLPLYLIFKGKQQYSSWFKAARERPQ